MIEFPKRILLFGMQQEKKKSIMRLCREMHIPVTQVPSGRYLQPLGVLAGVPMMQEKQIFYDPWISEWGNPTREKSLVTFA